MIAMTRVRGRLVCRASLKYIFRGIPYQDKERVVSGTERNRSGFKYVNWKLKQEGRRETRLMEIGELKV